MSKNVYIGNLPFDNTTKEELIEYMHPHAPKSVTLIFDRETRKFKGFAFAEFATEEEGRKCIDDLDGTSFGGRNLIVATANPRPERRDQGHQQGRSQSRARR